MDWKVFGTHVFRGLAIRCEKGGFLPLGRTKAKALCSCTVSLVDHHCDLYHFFCTLKTIFHKKNESLSYFPPQGTPRTLDADAQPEVEVEFLLRVEEDSARIVLLAVDQVADPQTKVEVFEQPQELNSCISIDI